ncbi:hypothetical protein CTAYLR_000874 [Chrysophaeum taylorii]|uniref:Calpain catalytic domain-containing protein n=1 Tax=Chrysophaeum taylorii TaxID=2483200 RepID=A0AAD7UR44_9STRA|nr:hypothetical protein CTAYLR_000874 [Chrysophaeum taylorii]
MRLLGRGGHSSPESRRKKRLPPPANTRPRPVRVPTHALQHLERVSEDTPMAPEPPPVSSVRLRQYDILMSRDESSSSKKANQRPVSELFESLLGLGLSEGVEAIRTACREAGELFVDREFNPPAGQMWLRPEDLQHDGERQAKHGRHEYEVIRDVPRGDDAIQGALGDCWLVSVISALASVFRGELLRHLFVAPEDRSRDAGVHGVRLCVGGLWRTYVVDERFPVIGNGVTTCLKAVYGSTRRFQLFVQLIEKAYAKASGGYDNLKGGRTSEASVPRRTVFTFLSQALYALTGCAVREHVLSEKTDVGLLWAQMLSAREAGFVLCAATRGDAVSVGLAPRHAYAIVNVVEVVRGRGRPNYRIVCLANPHGERSKYEWRGKFAYGSPEFETYKPVLLGPSVGSPKSQRARAATFIYLTLSDLRAHFDYVAVCEYRAAWCDVRAGGCATACRDSSDAFVVTTPAGSNTECTLQLAQPPARLGGPEHPADVALVVMPGLSTAPSTLFNAYAHCHLRASPDRDVDHLVVPLSFNHLVNKPVALVVRTANPVLLRRKKIDAATRRIAALAYVRNAPETKTARVGVANLVTRSDGSATFICVENDDQKRWMAFGVALSELSGCRTSRDHQSASTTRDPVREIVAHIPPRHAMIVVVVAAIQGTYSYRVKRRSAYVPAPPKILHNPPLAGPHDIHAPVPFAALP